MHLEGSQGLLIRDVQDWEDPQRPAESVKCPVLNDFIKTGLYTRCLPSCIFRFVLEEEEEEERRRARQSGLCGEPHVMLRSSSTQAQAESSAVQQTVTVI